ncbi:hypothetical protein Poly24_52680 [Rosistilla carotiformis]|uniref:Uncharacterized protein n=1 Tax=Rosistilla carotiformis TaxID=2528017 RepID=A0A518K163_9BACT|nr:hypothetical protein Poly24_52680 [Rosistilla carotiformis]
MIQKSKTTDTTVDDIHRTRREISESFAGDLHAIVEDARQRQATSGRPLWQPPANDQPNDSRIETKVSDTDNRTT